MFGFSIRGFWSERNIFNFMLSRFSSSIVRYYYSSYYWKKIWLRDTDFMELIVSLLRGNNVDWLSGREIGHLNGDNYLAMLCLGSNCFLIDKSRFNNSICLAVTSGDYWLCCSSRINSIRNLSESQCLPTELATTFVTFPGVGD
jgi:hypothetical protein